MKLSKKLKKSLNGTTIAIVLCVLIIVVALWFMFKPEENTTASGISLVSTQVKGEEEITEKKAREAAVKQFKSIGEKDVKAESLEVLKIQREGEEYYYISSLENTLEIKIKGGKITRLNSAEVNV